MLEFQMPPVTLYDFLSKAAPFAVLALIILAVIFLLNRGVTEWGKVEAIKADASKQKTASEAESEKNRAEAARFVAAAETARLAREEIKEKNLETREAQQTVTNQQMSLLLASLLTGQQLEVGAATRSERRIIAAGKESEDNVTEFFTELLLLTVKMVGEPPAMEAMKKAMEKIALDLKKSGQQAAGEAVDKAADSIPTVVEEAADATQAGDAQADEESEIAA